MGALVLAMSHASPVSAQSPTCTSTQGQSCYTYDALGRLTSEADADGTLITYSYDSAGNRTQVVTNPGTIYPPVANPITVSTPAATALTFNPLVNDTDPSGYTISVASLGTPSHGTANFTATSVTYTPTYGWLGTDSFTYYITDGHGNTVNSTITVNVNPSAAPPVAVNDSVSTTENTAITFDPRTNDSDPNGYGLTVTSVATPSHGTATNTTTSITYTPSANWYGADSFGYTISDGHGGTSNARVNVTVPQPASPPVANPATINLNYTLSTGTTVTPAGSVNPLTGDSSPEGYTLTVTAVGAPTRGTVTFTGTSISYTYYKSVRANSTGYTDTDSFTYTISDGHGGTATSTVTVNINVGTNQ
jgi:YD repeat-containing protein